MSPMRSVTATTRSAPASRAARETVSRMPETIPSSCMRRPYASSSVAKKPTRLPLRPCLPSRAMITKRVTSSDTS